MQTIVKENRNFFGENKRPYNVIGQAYFDAEPLKRAEFMAVALTKHKKLGGEDNNLARTFRDVHSKVNITKVPVCYFHAANIVFGMVFPLSVSDRKAIKTEVFTIQEKDYILTVTEL